ncbi:hypothetical protein PSI19_21445 [Xenorhabdus khoisanae]|uniref:hypothetical protein n=1 Tax=Xenorhabdus khoisanae TaxID=880157 RepID=UPI00235A0156|nr:hypothetical protein [Xenorhabdus khoisanae]MDC9616359.1 hypothetical protein [Xenorhabdus khoisanae]
MNKIHNNFKNKSERLSMNCNDFSARNSASNALTTARFAQGTADRAANSVNYTSREIAELKKRIEALQDKIQG